MGGWGGVVAQGLAGAVSGIGKGGLDDIVEKEKIAAQRLRDEQLARIAKEQIKYAADIEQPFRASESKAQRESTERIATQSDLTHKQSNVTTAQNADTSAKAQQEAERHNKFGEVNAPATSAEAKALLRAQVNYYNAFAAQKEAAGSKPNKEDYPDLVEKKTEAGDVLIDKRTGLVGRIVPGEDAVPGKTHWFRPDDPGKPAKPVHTEWTDSEGMPARIEQFYPKLSKKLEAGTDVVIPGREVSGKISDPLFTSPQGGSISLGKLVNGKRYIGGDPKKASSWQ